MDYPDTSFVLEKIRESIRALFPDRECFTLVRPVNNEKDLQRLDQLPVSISNSSFFDLQGTVGCCGLVRQPRGKHYLFVEC